MKIVFLLEKLEKGGAERVASILANKFNKDSYQVEIWTLHNSKIAYHFQSSITIKSLSLKAFYPKMNFIIKLYHFLKRIYVLSKALKQSKPNIIIAFGDSVNLTSILARMIFRIKIPLILSIRSNPELNAPKQMRRLINIFYRFADTIVVQTNFIKDVIEPYVRNVPIKVLPNPVKIVQKKRSSENKKKYHFLSVGRLVALKNHAQLIESFAQIKTLLPTNAKLCIAGAGKKGFYNDNQENEQKNLESIIEENNLQENVILLGNIDNIEAIYQQSMIFVHPSSYEGMSNALLEAMSFGLPCIVSNYDGVTDVITNNKNGIIVPLKNSNALKNAMLRLSRDQKLRLKFSEASSKAISEKFELNLIYKKWVSLLTNLANNKK